MGADTIGLEHPETRRTQKTVKGHVCPDLPNNPLSPPPGLSGLSVPSHQPAGCLLSPSSPPSNPPGPPPSPAFTQHSACVPKTSLCPLRLSVSRRRERQHSGPQGPMHLSYHGGLGTAPFLDPLERRRSQLGGLKSQSAPEALQAPGQLIPATETRPLVSPSVRWVLAECACPGSHGDECVNAGKTLRRVHTR